MLDVIMGQGLKDTLIVVTRYFGGTLLGTGGLVRAYTAASLAGLEESIIIEKVRCYKVSMNMDYTNLGKIQYIAAQMQILVLAVDYTDQVRMGVLVPEGDFGAFSKKVTQATGGKVEAVKDGVCYGADVMGQTMVFEK